MSVLVLEAGGSADKLEIRAPLGTGALHNLQDKQDLVDWKYRSNDGAVSARVACTRFYTLTHSL